MHTYIHTYILTYTDMYTCDVVVSTFSRQAYLKHVGSQGDSRKEMSPRRLLYLPHLRPHPHVSTSTRVHIVCLCVCVCLCVPITRQVKEPMSNRDDLKTSLRKVMSSGRLCWTWALSPGLGWPANGC